jgi:RCR-type E3 ubiquitin transferase
MDGLLESRQSKFSKDKVQLLNYVDITDSFEFAISSRQAMVSALTDNSTETFWESDDENRNKPKIIEISSIKPHFVCKSINIHIDNCRDLAYKVTSFTVYSGLSLGELNFSESVEAESNIGSWYQVLVKVRQIKILGNSNENVNK